METNNNVPQPLVSVIVPVYNVEKYIGECIESIIAQDYRNIELIIVDDGTPDNAGAISDEYAKKDSRIRVIHQENRGVAAARNHGIDEARGDFITFIDSDDWIATDYVTHLMRLQKDSDADMCLTTQFFTQKSDVQTSTVKVEIMSAAEATALLLSPKVGVGSWNKLYRRSWLITNGIRQSEQLFSGEGLHFITRATQHSNKVSVSNRKIYYYRRNVSESATTKFNIKMFTNNELSLDMIEKDMIVHDMSVNTMLALFRFHLCTNGYLAVLQNSSVKEYPDEIHHWRKIMLRGLRLLFSPIVPIKSKVRILGANISPSLWARLAESKRSKIFRESV